MDVYQNELSEAINQKNTTTLWRILNKIGTFEGRTDLFLLPFRPYDFDIANIMFSFEYDLNLFKDGSTILHLAAWAGNTELVKDLVSRGASLNVGDASGNTPLHRGALMSFKLVKSLVDGGTNVHTQNAQGDTALHIVTGARHVNIETARLLISRHTTLDIRNKEGKTPIDLLQTDELVQSVFPPQRRWWQRFSVFVCFPCRTVSHDSIEFQDL